MSTSATANVLSRRPSALPPSPTDSASDVALSLPPPPHPPPSPTSDAERDDAKRLSAPDAPFRAAQVGSILAWLEERAVRRRNHDLFEPDAVFHLTPANYHILLDLLDPPTPSKEPRLRRIAAWASDNLRYSYSACRQQLRIRMVISDIHQEFLEAFRHGLRNALDDAIKGMESCLADHERVRLSSNPILLLKDGTKMPDAVVTLKGSDEPWVVVEIGYQHPTTDTECKQYLEDAQSDAQAVIRADIVPRNRSPQQRLAMANSDYSVRLDCWYIIKNADGQTFRATRKRIRNIEVHATGPEGSIDIELRYLDPRWQDTETVASIPYSSIRAWLNQALEQQRKMDLRTTGTVVPERVPRPIKRGREDTPPSSDDVASSFDSADWERDGEQGDEDYKGKRVDVAIRSPRPKRPRRGVSQSEESIG
ncbi:hypothetical protein Tdes44962_MAKER09681 [Teratosphaeria destructans]|uniref:Uncharacterized protein n=1 Tax=Teratosphaeria destructans TaxID=418781 RepID=A0A9W7SRR7_9PEZI|nr:hypothetical protein Tdes44962_MAKER09681 [Teratosphaeria destructans]